MSTTDIILSRQTVHSLQESNFLFQTEMFNFHLKRELNDVSREPASHAKQISVSKKLPWHESPFWSVLFD